MAADAETVRWTNPSVRILAGDADPVAVITERARSLLLAAIDAGLPGPPVDPFRLADLMGLRVLALADVSDARIGPSTDQADVQSEAPLANYVRTASPLTVEYNPTRPRGRLRYSVAHEIAHALFPDVADTVRLRTGTGAVPHAAGDDAWQLELLCNIAAAELLMPREAVEGLLDIDPDIDFIMATRTRLDVSTEALLRRLAEATPRPLAVVAASRIRDTASSPLRVEYVHPSRGWAPQAERGARLESATAFGEPTAVGQTARGTITIDDETLLAQTVGIPPYPGAALPRVLGLVEPPDAPRTAPPGIQYMGGDVVHPDAEGAVIIGHVVSDAAHAWGKTGVAKSLASRYKDAARAFRAWSIADPGNLRLGNLHHVNVSGKVPLVVASVAKYDRVYP
ncbi:MAG: ImmA/IrrE family metallo-endopeptidase [Actinomycetota bacterium]|nr:ImmA/IrrE family metallo-endopeptidase [Actinomycetota bacterium]